MLITELKAKETLLSLVSGKVFVINCHGCKETHFPALQLQIREVRSRSPRSSGPQDETLASGKVAVMIRHLILTIIKLMPLI